MVGAVSKSSTPPRCDLLIYSAMRSFWNHNSHYHDLLLAQIPRSATRILDVGCGYGSLARRMTEEGYKVDAIDADQTVVEDAQELHIDLADLQFRCANFLSDGAPNGPYDALTCVAALHHMPFAEAAAQIVRHLRPGGTLVVLGLYRVSSPADYALSVIAFPFSRMLSLFRDARSNRSKCEPPLRDPEMTLTEIRDAAEKLLPQVRIRRLLLWRYLLVWQRPA